MAGRIYRSSLAMLAGCITAARLPAAGSDLNTLLQNSPFGRSTNAPAGSSDAPLQFRGVMAEGDTFYFSIFEPATALSNWVGLNESSLYDFVIKGYDADNRQLTVDYQGRIITLSLEAATGLPQTNPTPAPTRTASNPAATVGPQSPSNNIEADRLRKVAEEIKRRRALRQQTTNNPAANPR